MYIKQIIIEGFRSFRDRTVIQNFDKHVNCVVGYNGSGKSNIFAAIEFVLSNEFSRLSAKERSYLLHRYSSKIKSGRVKLVVDNTDRSLRAFDTDEVHISREITSAQCKLKINDHQITFKELMKHMSTAGFIKAFAKYYMLKQGSITKLAMQSDAERLQLLYEITGTSDFLEGSKEVNQLMNQFRDDAEIYGFKLQHFGPEIEQAKRDVEKYKKYIELQNTKTTLMYFHNKKEYDVLKKELRELEAKFKAHDKLNELKQKHTEMKEQVQKYTLEYEKSKSELTKNRAMLHVLYARMKELNKRKKNIELAIENGAAKKAAVEKRKLEAIDQITAFTNDLKLTEAELEEVNKNITIAKANAFKAQDEFSYHRGRQKYLEWKKHIITSTETIEERTNIFKRVLRESKKGLEREVESRNLCKKDVIDRNKVDIEVSKSDEIKYTNEYERVLNSIKQKLTLLHKTEQKCNDLQTEMQNILTKKRSLFDELSSADEDYIKAKESYNKYILTELVIGNSMVKNILMQAEKTEGSADLIEGYYGTLIDLLECPQDCAVAVELVAGELLYSHVVKSADLAMRFFDIRDTMNKAGEVRFLILDEFVTHDFRLPRNLDSDYNPLLTNLEYDSQFHSIFTTIFGNAFRCRNMDTVSPPTRLQNKHKFIMQSNVLWDLDGSITIGVSDSALSSVSLAKNSREQLSKCSEIKEKLKLLDQEFDDHSEKQNKVFKLKESLKREHNLLVQQMDSTFNKYLVCKEYVFNFESHKIRHEEAYAKTCLDVKIIQERVNDIQSCLEDVTRLAAFPDAEKTELVRLNERLPHLKRTVKTTGKEYEDLYKSQAHLNSRCYNVRVFKEDARKVLDDSSFDLYCPQIETNTQDVAKAEYQISEAKTKVTKILQHVQNLNQRIAELQQEIFTEESELHTLKKEMDKAFIERMKMNEKRSELKAKLADKENDIGNYPMDGNGYSNMSLEELQLALIRLEKEIFQCSDERWTENVYDHERIEEAIKLIEGRFSFDESIELLESIFTKFKEQNVILLRHQFRDIQMNFEATFSRIAPSGSASLSLIESTDVDGDDGSLDSYLGVGLNATFDTSRGDLTHVRSLSGGERTMVVFAFIFSMFSNKNAPLFLLDEADSALSQTNRSIVVDFIKEMSTTTQFFIVTFRPELLTVAEKYFCTYILEGCSHVKEIDCAEALRIINHNNLERENEFNM